MIGAFFKNMPTVVKNLLIINVLFFLATVVFERQGIYLTNILSIHYFDDPSFQPYQLVTHFFMHSGFGHLAFNMFALLFTGIMLEQLWGPKKFLFFYFATAIGGAFVDMIVKAIQLYSVFGTIHPESDGLIQIADGMISYNSSLSLNDLSILLSAYSNGLGASGAIYGLIAGIAYTYPNMEVRLLLFPVPMKMKWYALMLAVFAVVQGMERVEGDSVGHLAHLSGMLVGFLIMIYWRKSNKHQF